MNGLPDEKRALIASFLESANLVELYQQYAWGHDSWETGFIDIVALEQRTGSAVRSQQLSRSHVIAIAEWGGYRDPSRILCAKDPLMLPLYHGSRIAPFIENDPVLPVRMISQQTRGIGPTYASKILRFAMPSVYGAIDSRIVRVFGEGDPDSSRYPLLDLIAEQGDSGRWAISRHDWPGEYGTWLLILRHMAQVMNMTHEPCPHPAGFLKAELRNWGTWVPADVEMAMFSYASQEIRK